MKLKEAQLLGILALIAGGIIVLCMWGGGREKQLVSQDEADEFEAIQDEEPMAWDVDELLKRLHEEQERAAVSEREISEEIESSQPEEIPLRELEEEPVKEEKPAAPRIHVVEKGDTLSAISRKYYNTASKWKIIFEANKGLISRPEELRPQMKLVIPQLDELKPSIPPTGGEKVVGEVASARELHALSASGKRYYDVRKGDTLWNIAERFYGNGREWKKILEANSDLLGDSEDLRPNMRLLLP